MKKSNFLARYLMFIGILTLFFTWASAQTVDTTGVNQIDLPDTIGEMNQAYNYIFGALVILWGYIARLLGLKTDKVPFVFVVLAGGLVVAGVFIATSIGEAIPLVFSFLGSLGIYDLLLKPIEKAAQRNRKEAA